jgi:DnaJ-class molecular chaperone
VLSDNLANNVVLRRAKLLHPDGQHPESSTDRFATLKKAHTLLSKAHTRAAYLQSGHGWARDDHADPRSDPDWKMRQEVMFRSRVRRGFAEGGSGAWGGFDGSQWKPNNDTGFDMEFSAEPTYMSNPKFLGTLGLVVS